MAADRRGGARLSGFEYATVEAAGTTYRPGVTGDGPPVLLLHGFPQTHHCWRLVTPRLTGRTVVACDLKGYGSTRAAPGGPRGEGYSNRERAAELVAVMAALGFDRFAVVGHDRGARVAYRMALDHPDVVERLAVLNIVPTADQFERMAADAALDYWPWYLLAQPAPFPERVVGASAEFVVRDVLRAWAATPGAVEAEPYVDAFNVDGVCADYRASFHLDRPTDEEDQRSGRRIACPVLVHWGATEDALSDGPLPVWRTWADDVAGAPLPCGHFIPEEAPDELAASLNRFLGGGG